MQRRATQGNAEVQEDEGLQEIPGETENKTQAGLKALDQPLPWTFR